MNKTKGNLSRSVRTLSMAVGLAVAAGSGFAQVPVFFDTNDAAAWSVSTVVGGTDGALSSFSTANFKPAAAVTARPGWISNVPSGSNGSVGTWTFFVFRETFTLTPAQVDSADLKFTWAADDSGQGFLDRGSWTPKFSLNGASLAAGSWPDGDSYNLGSPTDLKSGFVAGTNTIDFYVEGNGQTDGMALAVPEPAPFALVLAGVGALGFARLRRRRSRP